MSSGLIPRGMAVAASSSRSLLTAAAAAAAAAAAGPRSLHVHDQLLHHRPSPHQQPAASRGLTHRPSGGEAGPTKHQQRHRQNQRPSADHGSSERHHPKDHQHQTRRPSTTQAHADASPSYEDSRVKDPVRYSVMASQQVFHHATLGHLEEWALAQPNPQAKLQRAVAIFGKRHFVDELPSRTRKSVAKAAAAGKEYVTTADIVRVFATISDGEQVMTEEEAIAICEAWGSSDATEQAGAITENKNNHGAPSGGDAGAAAAGVASPRIPVDVFWRLLSIPSAEARK